MRVLHINQSDRQGGASLAAFWLHEELNRRGHDSRILARRVDPGDPRLASFAMRPTATERMLLRFTARAGLNYVHLLSTRRLLKHPFFAAADVVHFHNLHDADGGYFNYLALPRLARAKPCTITLHDMWALTGHCAYSNGCDRWQHGCGACPDLTLYPAVHRDATRWEYLLKRRAFARANLPIICPSRWMFELVKRSHLSAHTVHHVPNGIDVQQFFPVDRDAARRSLSCPPDKFVLLADATAFAVARKGGDCTRRILGALTPAERARLHVLVYGRDFAAPPELTGIGFQSVGYLRTAEQKRTFFSAGDALLFPSREDNLPLTLLEALACGTPAIAFRIGGIPDVVVPDRTGFLFAAADVTGPAALLRALSADRAPAENMRAACRAKAIAEFSWDVVLDRILEIYRAAIQAHPTAMLSPEPGARRAA